MKAVWIHAEQVTAAEDWRPVYQLSGAAWLGRHAGAWVPVGQLGDCLDGWRVSSNPASSGYDPRIERAPVYRLRHIEPMELRTEAEHWLPPLVSEEPYCVQPGDVLVRRVGCVAAALVGERHRHHPADANLGIVRGMTPDQALWTAFCINQPHYRDYLEGAATIGDLVRVGLRRIAEMPLAPKPEGVDRLAEHWFQALDREAQGLEQLYRLRQAVRDWLIDLLPDLKPFMDTPLHGSRWAWFDPLDLSDQLNMALAEQQHVARALGESGRGASLGRLAQIGPRSPRVAKPQRLPSAAHQGCGPTARYRHASRGETRHRLAHPDPRHRPVRRPGLHLCRRAQGRLHRCAR